MKIALVIDSLARGGAERQVLYSARALALHGCDVELIYYHQADLAYDAAALKGPRVTFLPKRRRYLTFLWQLYNHLRKRRFDVVHAFKSTPSLYGCVAAKLAGAPVVLGGLRVEYDERGLVRLLHMVVNRFVAGWIVNSYGVAASAVRAIGARRESCFVVYNAIAPEEFVSTYTRCEAKRRIGLNATSPVVSLIARLHPQKNHALFLEMARMVLQRHPNTYFLIVGDGEMRPVLQERARALGIAGQVRFLGVRTDIPDLLAATDVSVLTSHYEGLSNSLLESMCVGLPVVTTDYAGVEELVTHGREGFIIPRDDARTFGEKVDDLLADPALRQSMGERGRQMVEKRFTMNSAALNLLAVYSRCLAQAGRSPV